jgi:hypothetical protein
MGMGVFEEKRRSSVDKSEPGRFLPRYQRLEEKNDATDIKCNRTRAFTQA